MIKTKFTGESFYEIVEQMKHCIATVQTMKELAPAQSAETAAPVPPTPTVFQPTPSPAYHPPLSLSPRHTSL